MEFNTRLAEILEEKGIRQAELSRKTGLATSLISNYITGKTSPSLDYALKIANALGITLDDMVGRKRSSLSKVQRALLADFDSLNDEGQSVLTVVLNSLKVSHGKNTKIKGGVVQTNTNGNNFFGVSGGSFNSTWTIK